jgi:heme-degrading monooxygenase HmoA
MVELYTYAVWIVRSGCEDEFVARWREMADWTAVNVPGAGTARLLQDEDHPGRFISLGPWESREAVSSWRSLLGFQERIGRMRELLETFTRSTMTLRAEVQGAGAACGARADAGRADAPPTGD